MRLIDADSLLEELRKMEVISPDRKDLFTGPARIAVFGRIGEQPTIDAVPVVRCKDCKWFVLDTTGGAYCNHPTCGLFNGYEPDAFCSYGERKEEV